MFFCRYVIIASSNYEEYVMFKNVISNLKKFNFFEEIHTISGISAILSMQLLINLFVGFYEMLEQSFVGSSVKTFFYNVSDWNHTVAIIMPVLLLVFLIGVPIYIVFISIDFGKNFTNYLNSLYFNECEKNYKI